MDDWLARFKKLRSPPNHAHKTDEELWEALNMERENVEPRACLCGWQGTFWETAEDRCPKCGAAFEHLPFASEVPPTSKTVN